MSGEPLDHLPEVFPQVQIVRSRRGEDGPPCPVGICDGSAPGAALWRLDGETIVLAAPPNTELGRQEAAFYSRAAA